MDNIYRGQPVSKETFINKLEDLKQNLEEDLMLGPLAPEIVIEAAQALASELNQQELAVQLSMLGIPQWAAVEYVKVAVQSLSREPLTKKLHIELGEEPFEWKKINEEIYEKEYPLGVLLHIGAGNALGLSAFSVIEGLLAGNINILKLPENEGGLSSRLLLRLLEIEPRLKPYIYVLDVSSRDTEVIEKLMETANAVAVWGSGDAIKAVRQLAPPSIPIIEWGHRMSFAYFTKHGSQENDLQGLARDICTTDQLYCSSPQCVFFETDSTTELDDFADRLARHIKAAVEQYPSAVRLTDIQAQITWALELVRMEEILKQKRLITDEGREYSVMVDYKSELKASPLFRNIWVVPVRREELLSLLRLHKGYLQTVGLSCSSSELGILSDIFYAAGVTRITACGYMSMNYAGEPHDGSYALRSYTRRVNRRFNCKSLC